MITGDLTRYALSMQSLISLRAPGGSSNTWITGVLIAESLNKAFKSVMANPALQWVWVMGDDHTYDPGLLLRLLDREKDVIAPLCLNRAIPMDPVIVEMRPEGARMKYLESLPTEGLYRLEENETCGDAGMLIRRNVLEKLGPPWYETKKSGSLNAEDQAFTRRIKDAGFDIFVDLDNPMGHLGTICYIPVKKGDHFEVRLASGVGDHVADLGALCREVPVKALEAAE